MSMAVQMTTSRFSLDWTPSHSGSGNEDPFLSIEELLRDAGEVQEL